MKVKVIDVNKYHPDYWYNKYVGNIFEVIGEDKYSYSVRPEYLAHEPGVVAYHIHKDDCEIVFQVGDKVKFLRCKDLFDNILDELADEAAEILKVPNYMLKQPYGFGEILDIGDKYYIIDEDGRTVLSKSVELIDEIFYVPKDLITKEGKLIIKPETELRYGLSFYYSSSLKMWCTNYGATTTSDKEEFKLVKINSIEDMKEGYFYYDDNINNKEELGNYENYGIKIGDKIYYYIDNTVVYIPLDDYEYGELYEVKYK